jgi:hypothetical protein
VAHFAELDENNVVLRVIVVANEDTADEEGNEVEAIGVAFCKNLLGGTWVQTSYNNNFRKQYAGIGYTYDLEADVFVVPQPFPSWSLDENYEWQAPTAHPDDGNSYIWSEQTQTWERLEND